MKSLLDSEYDHESGQNKTIQRIKRIEVFVFIVAFFNFAFILNQHAQKNVSSTSLQEFEERILAKVDKRLDLCCSSSHEPNESFEVGENKKEVLVSKNNTPTISLKKQVNKSSHKSSNTNQQFYELKNLTNRHLQNGGQMISCSETVFRLELELDDWAEETSWELINEATKMVVANDSYSIEDNWSSASFETCIERGSYQFALNDRIGDGISCRVSPGCYTIYIDDELLIQGGQFRGKTATHTFDSSSKCIVGSLFQLRFPSSFDTSAVNWTFLDSVSTEFISLNQDFEENENELIYFSCLSSGIYSFTMSENTNILCADLECYSLSVNDEVFFYEDSFDTEKVSHMIILENQSVTFCDQTLLRVDLKLDHWAPENRWELRDSTSNEIVAHKEFSEEDNFLSSVVGICLDPGHYVFILYDDFGDGINCESELGCYEIYANNTLLIEGSSFTGNEIIHSFDFTSFCVMGSPFLLEIPRDLVGEGIVWTLQESVSAKMINLEHVPGDMTFSFKSCLSPGIYSFNVIDAIGSESVCYDESTCYRISIDNNVMFQGGRFSGKSTKNFIVSENGNVTFCDGTFFRIDLKLDANASQTSWKLQNVVTNKVVMRKTYSEEDNLMSTVFASCIEPGKYEFSLHDNFGDGINCGSLTGCYNIYVDNMPLIQDVPFDGTSTSHMFDSASSCVVGFPFFIEIHNEAHLSGIVWNLHESSSSEEIAFKQNVVENGIPSYYSCLSEGSYVFTLFDLHENAVNCDESLGCYRLSINEGLYFQGDNYSEKSSHYFTISDNGDVSFCEGTFFQLDLHLDDWASQISWDLRNGRTFEIVAAQNYTQDDNWSQDFFETCIDPGLYSFSLHDAFGDGISCESASGCYTIFINNQVAIEGSTFEGEIVSHSFDSNSECVIGTRLLLEIPIAVVESGVKFSLKNGASDVDVKFEATSGGNGSFLTYFACVKPGIYTFSLSGSNVMCDESFGCYRLIHNNEIIFKGGIFLEDAQYTFYVNETGDARGRVCGSLPILSPVNAKSNFEYDTRVAKILEIMKAISSANVLYENTSPQYKAACWIIYDDVFQLEPRERNIFERYALAVFLYSTNQDAEILLFNGNCAYERVSCDDEGHIREINMGTAEVGFHGTIPSEISFFRSLEVLDTGGNPLYGTVPTELGGLTKLKRICLHRTNLSGTLPSELGRLTNLEELQLDISNVGGTIPSEIGRISKLSILDLSKNRFEGTIPSELFLCTNLKRLQLHSNELRGSVPRNINQLSNLERLTLSDNEITGQLPSEFGMINSLQFIFMAYNLLTGTIPREIRNNKLLNRLVLNNNLLNGTVPDIFRNLTQLKYIDISRNNLEGSIPNSLWSNELEKLHLQFNKIESKVPIEACDGNPSVYEVDNLPWFLDEPKVKCQCCGISTFCYLWQITPTVDGGAHRPKCPSSNFHNIQFYSNISIEDEITDITLSEMGVQNKSFRSWDVCLSPSGCYSVNYSTGPNSNLSSYHLGYSSELNSLVQQDRCDAIVVCNEVFESNHPRREAINHLTQVVIPELSSLQDTSTAQQKALCWIMTTDALFHDYNTCDGTLLQRFVLIYFYFATNAFSAGLQDQFEEMASTPTCEWKGITCDSGENYVEAIENENLGLTGYIITEIGLLPRLRSINLTNNDLQGYLKPSMFIDYPHLEVFDVSNNFLEGDIPKELLQVPQLKRLILKNNRFVGSIPSGFHYSDSLEHFDVSNNFLLGGIPEDLYSCINLTFLDLSRNGLDGSISSSIENLNHLGILKFDQNKLSGTIPPGLFTLTQMKKLMLQTNRLTGSLPSEIGKLESTTHIILNHNLLKSTIPTELKKLNNLEMLHLHFNRLTGSAPDLSKFQTDLTERYITDCGEPFFLLPGQLSCETCSMCCNSEKYCQETEAYALNTTLLGILVVLVIPTGLAIMLSCTYFKMKSSVASIFVDSREPLSVYSQDSIYCLILAHGYVAKILFFFMAGLQIWLYTKYIFASEVLADDTDHQFTFICPDHMQECENTNSWTISGWFLFSMILVAYLGADFMMALVQLRKAVYHLEPKLFLSGFVALVLNVLTLYTSWVYNMALAEKDTELITNVVALLFINYLDEEIMYVFRITFPEWTEDMIESTKRHMLKLQGNYASRESANTDVM